MSWKPPQIETQEAQSHEDIRNVTLKAMISSYSSKRIRYDHGRAPDTVGHSGQLAKSTLSTDYPHQDYKRQGGQRGHPFSGVDPGKNHHIKKNEYGDERSEKN